MHVQAEQIACDPSRVFDKNKRFVAKFFDVSVNKVDRWVMNRQGPPFIKVGAQVRYCLADILDYAESCRTNSRGGRAA
jgi:hypothetical protein